MSTEYFRSLAAMEQAATAVRPPIEILASNRRRIDRGSKELGRFCTWVGDPGWPGVPRASDYWIHCGGWAAETVYQVFYNGPDVLDGSNPHDAAVSIEIQTSAEVIVHLIEVHGFEDGGAS